MVAAAMAFMKNQQAQQASGEPSFYSYGQQPQTIEQILNPAASNEAALANSQNANTEVASLAGNAQLPAYKKGGQVMSSALMAAKGGHIPDKAHPEYDGSVPVFRTGGDSHHVQGPGDGQSDDIPAMLADGEFVFDADTVSQLGNGSNKAGAELLNAMREALRAHKRSAPIGKIPPKSKSVLEYLREGMKMKGLK